jgi:hypothetical protein
VKPAKERESQTAKDSKFADEEKNRIDRIKIVQFIIKGRQLKLISSFS